MKNILILFFTVLFSISAKADYNGYHITFTIENISGQKSKGYVYVTYLKMDSLQNTEYLKRALDQSIQDENWENRNTLTYYKERIIYNYIPAYIPVEEQLDNTEQSYEYYLTRKTKMLFSSIKKITIDEMINWSYAIGMSVLKESSDLSWLKEKPIKSYFFNSYLCEFQIFTHEKNDRIDEHINRLTKIQKEIDKIATDYGNSEHSNNERDKLMSKLEETYEKMSDEVDKFIEQLEGYKIVIITSCTC